MTGSLFCVGAVSESWLREPAGTHAAYRHMEAFLCFLNFHKKNIFHLRTKYSYLYITLILKKIKLFDKKKDDIYKNVILLKKLK